MIKKKSKFFTGVFSLIPGAGQMFMGFMKQGVSIMATFFAIIFLSSWLNIGPLMFAIPVLWFYSFFDAINKMSLDDEEFYAQEDKYLVSVDKLLGVENTFFQRRNLFFGIILAFLGVYLIWNNCLNYFQGLLPYKVYAVLYALNNIFPQFAIGVIIIIIGIKMIIGKKESAKND